MDFVALRMLVGDRAKYLAIVLGLTFTALLLTQQMSIFVGLLERSYSPVIDIRGADLWVMDERVAYIDDQMIELSARELSLLEVLLQRAGRLVSKDQLVERLCEWGEEVSNNAIEVYIHRLRKKIEQGPVRIATVRGLGYCLEKIAA